MFVQKTRSRLASGTFGGELLDSNLGRFEDVTIPIKVEDEAIFGDVIRIIAFEDEKACKEHVLWLPIQ